MKTLFLMLNLGGIGQPDSEVPTVGSMLSSSHPGVTLGRTPSRLCVDPGLGNTNTVRAITFQKEQDEWLEAGLLTTFPQAQGLAPSRDGRFLLLGHGFSGIWPNPVLLFL